MLKEKIRRIKLSRLPEEEQIFLNRIEGMQSYTPYKGYKFIYYYKDDTILFGYDIKNNKISYNKDVFYPNDHKKLYNIGNGVFLHINALNNLTNLIKKYGIFYIICHNEFGKFMSFRELKNELVKKKYSMSRYFLRNYYDKRQNKTD